MGRQITLPTAMWATQHMLRKVHIHASKIRLPTQPEGANQSTMVHIV